MTPVVSDLLFFLLVPPRYHGSGNSPFLQTAVPYTSCTLHSLLPPITLSSFVDGAGEVRNTLPSLSRVLSAKIVTL